MTRGTETNEAFMVTTGEQTAVDIFAQSIATDWIDLPAHARRAELNGLGDSFDSMSVRLAEPAYATDADAAEHWPDSLVSSGLDGLVSEFDAVELDL